MYLKNHICKRFIEDEMLVHELLQKNYPAQYKELLIHAENDTLNSVPKDTEDYAKIHSLWNLLTAKGQRAYLVTNTVLDKLEMLKVKPNSNNQYDWTIFPKAKGKYTFILPATSTYKGGGCLRVLAEDKMIQFCHISMTLDNNKTTGQLKMILWYIDRNTGEFCSYWKDHPHKEIDKFCYHLFCFLFLSDITEKLVKPGEKHGTKKQDKTINFLNCPLTIVNSNWNVTSIRTEGFDVSGHFRLQPTKNGVKMIFIEPFRKHGYVRKAGKEAAEV